MKKTAGKIIFIFVLVLLANAFVGCASTSIIQYSFAQNEDEAATITFVQNRRSPGGSDREDVIFVDLEGVNLPEPDRKTSWADTITFPTGVPLNLRVEVRWESKPPKRKKEWGSKKIVFECPPLEPGNEYELRYIHETLGDFGFFGKIIDVLILGDILRLTNTSTGEVIYDQSFKLISM